MACDFQSIGNIPDCLDPCLAAGVGGFVIPERVVIEEACQDADNVNILYILATVNGVFDYTPQLEVLYVNENNQETVTDVSNRFIFNYKSDLQSVQEFPIATNCGSQAVLMAWDIGLQIPNFDSLTEMTLRLSMNGEFNAGIFRDDIFAEIATIFDSSDPSTEYLFVKGPSATPYALYYDEATGELKLQYAGLGSLPCVCDINCGDLSIDGQVLDICEDEIQEVSVTTSSLVGDPINVGLVFRDVIGNVTDLSAQLVHQVTPHPPASFYINDLGGCVQVLPYFASTNGVPIDKEKSVFQIWKYTNTEDNIELLQDWSTKRWTSIFDKDIIEGNSYGYSIRFRGEFGEASEISAWDIAYASSTIVANLCDQDFGSFVTPDGDFDFGTFTSPLESCDGGTW
jgi:hypothetical protein